MQAVGIDFGTTNSAVAVCETPTEAPRLVEFAQTSGPPEPTFRSILYFERDDEGVITEHAGPDAIARYLAADEPGRLMQSLKSFLAARDFSVTQVFGRAYRLEALIGAFLRTLRERACAVAGELEGTIVVGRPVHFVSAQSDEDGELAVRRLRAAYFNAGFADVYFEFEPVAAAYHYERSLDHDELILIVDIGGGTSDFCLLRVGPSRRSRSAEESLLDTEGVPIAGDNFDGRIVRHTVSPALGLGSTLKSMFGRELEAPAWLYAHLERWHHLSFLRTHKSLQLLHDLIREAVEPQRFEAFLYVVKQNLGFTLHSAIEQTKRQLSEARVAPLDLVHGPLALHESVHRSDFSSWIWEDVEKLGQAVDRLLGRHALAEGDVDRVFLTGGSSFVPAVRNLFRDRFGEAKLRTGQELTSIASGLALCALERS